MEKHHITLLSKDDEEYPALLNTLYDAPMFLFVQGAPLRQEDMVAIVGSRKATPYGIQVATTLAHDLAQGGLTIVSGGAYGIDAAAHRGALSAPGKTIAVLASGHMGVDTGRQRALNAHILEGGGTVISEFSLFAPPLKHHFPIRNRIVSGLCRATIVVEAALPSGSLITAKAATEENREVCAVPGNITSPMSAGTNQLLQDGAHLVTHARDVFSLYGLPENANTKTPAKLPESASDDERRFFAVVTHEPKHIDDIANEAELTTPAASTIATTLELQGIIVDVGGRRFVRG